MSFQYLVFTGIIFVVFYTWKNKKLWAAKIQQYYPANKHILREIKYSISTLFILALIVTLVSWAGKVGLTRSYRPIDKYGYGYYFLSFFLMMAVHDTYFYWLHRLLHWKPLFKWAHKIHHLSFNPSPFSSYAFHPLEAALEMCALPVIAFTIPYHSSIFTFFGFYSISINVMGHAGYEFFPKGFARHKIFKWVNTSTHHNLHHRFVKCNYGLYFNLWDRVMKTNHPKYEDYYEEVIEQRETAKTITKKEVVQTDV